jgi:hypothetical protein
MITKLTKAQRDRFPEFVDKWTKIGLCTEPANRKEAEKGVIEAYGVAGLKAPRIVWCGSPLSQGLTRAIIIDKTMASVWASVGDSVWASVGDSVGDSVWASVWASVGASVGDSVRASVWASVGDSVGDSVWASVRASVWASVGDSVGDSAFGQHEAGWLSFYRFFRVVCGLRVETDKLKGINTVAENAGWWLPHANICWISERHNILSRNDGGRLHKDEAPALQYPDGFSIYALNGVRMKAEYVLPPAEKLDPALVLKETNVDVRRELLRKIGIERYMAVTKHKVLDTQGDYELLSIDLTPEIKDARYLKMKNPSIGVWHVEGVHPTCKTVQHCLNWRAHGDMEKDWTPEILT